jgi:hypothetical protein
MSVYKTIIRPVVTYGSETWIMNNTHEEKLKIFEREILRSIYGPVQDTNNEWRVRTNQETEALIKEANIVRFIKSQRLAWYGHVNRMEDNKNVKALMKWNPTDRRSRGRPKTRWKDAVEVDLRAIKITNWRTRTEDKLAWKKIVEQAKTHPGL